MVFIILTSDHNLSLLDGFTHMIVSMMSLWWYLNKVVISLTACKTSLGWDPGKSPLGSRYSEYDAPTPRLSSNQGQVLYLILCTVIKVALESDYDTYPSYYSQRFTVRVSWPSAKRKMSFHPGGEHIQYVPNVYDTVTSYKDSGRGSILPCETAEPSVQNWWVPLWVVRSNPEILSSWAVRGNTIYTSSSVHRPIY